MSIVDFPCVELPDFTVITGVNGVGKTHLLKAIDCGKIFADVARNHETDARYFDWNSLVPNNTSESNTSKLYHKRDRIIAIADSARNAQVDEVNQWAAKYGVTASNRWQLLRSERNPLGNLVNEGVDVEKAWQELRQIAETIFNKMKESVQRRGEELAQLESLRNRIALGVVCPNNRDFLDDPFELNAQDLFQQSFAELFLAYFELYKQNLLRQLQEQKGQKPDRQPLSEEEFAARYKEPPWDFVNRILRQANLDFEIGYPVDLTTTKFTPQLRKITSGAEIRFVDLSSGERIVTVRRTAGRAAADWVGGLRMRCSIGVVVERWRPAIR